MVLAGMMSCDLKMKKGVFAVTVYKSLAIL